MKTQKMLLQIINDPSNNLFINSTNISSSSPEISQSFLNNLNNRNYLTKYIKYVKIKKEKVFSLENSDKLFLTNYYENGCGEIMYKSINLPIDKTSAVKFLNDSILYGMKCGCKCFKLVINSDSTFSNICAPVAGLIKYYENNKNIRFSIETKENGYISHTHIETPLIINNTNSKEINNPFDKVWFFRSDNDINALVNNYLLYIRKSDIIEKGVIESIDWCINEVLDNVLQHSEVGCGYIMGQIHPTNKRLSFCIFDYGIGIYNSLKKSTVHNPTSPIDAITMALQEKVTRDTNIGQGNGLWGLSSIINQSNGSLRISSNGATYSNWDGKEKLIKTGDFNLGKVNGTTTIDFQLDYSKKLDISSALTGYNYQYADLWLENLESDNNENNVILKVAELADGTGTRKSAQKFRNMILNIVNNDKKRIILDFNEVNTISSSFADELIGKIIKEYGFVFFNKIFRLENINKTETAIINRSVEQRMAQIYYDSKINIPDE